MWVLAKEFGVRWRWTATCLNFESLGKCSNKNLELLYFRFIIYIYQIYCQILFNVIITYQDELASSSQYSLRFARLLPNCASKKLDNWRQWKPNHCYTDDLKTIFSSNHIDPNVVETLDTYCHIVMVHEWTLKNKPCCIETKKLKNCLK